MCDIEARLELKDIEFQGNAANLLNLSSNIPQCSLLEWTR